MLGNICSAILFHKRPQLKGQISSTSRELWPTHPRRISRSAELMIDRESNPTLFTIHTKPINLNVHITVMRRAVRGKDSAVVTSSFRMHAVINATNVSVYLGPVQSFVSF